MLFQKLKLCQSQCYGVGFALALRAGFAHGVFAQKQFNVVAVHTSCGVAYNEVALACGIEVFEHTSLVEVAFVEHSHTFAIAGNGIVVAHENWFKRFNPPLSCRMNVGGVGSHLVLHGFVEQRVAKLLFDDGISLLHSLGVGNHGSQIFLVALRDNHIHKPAALFACAPDKVPVGRRHHHQRQ